MGCGSSKVAPAGGKPKHESIKQRIADKRHCQLQTKRQAELLKSFTNTEEAPMTVMPLTALLKHGVLPRSDIGAADLVLEGSRPNMKIVFISHRWMRPDPNKSRAHPDDASGTKFAVVVRGLRFLALQEGWDEEDVHVWLDFLCIDQMHQDLKLKGIQSLRAYVAKSDAVLVPAMKGFGYHGQGKVWAHYITEYGGRAWCRLEVFTAWAVALMKGLSMPPIYATDAKNAKNVTGSSSKGATGLHAVRYSYRAAHLPSGGVLFSEADRDMIRKHEEAVAPIYFEMLVKARCGKDSTSIDLSGQTFPPSTLTSLLRRLEKCAQVKELSLYSCGLEDEDLSQFVPVLAKWSNLEVLDIRGNKVSRQTVTALKGTLTPSCREHGLKY